MSAAAWALLALLASPAADGAAPAGARCERVTEAGMPHLEENLR